MRNPAQTEPSQSKIASKFACTRRTSSICILHFACSKESVMKMEQNAKTERPAHAYIYRARYIQHYRNHFFSVESASSSSLSESTAAIFLLELM